VVLKLSLLQAGVSVRLVVTPDMPHCHIPYSDFMGGHEVWGDIVEFVVKAMERSDVMSLRQGS